MSWFDGSHFAVCRGLVGAVDSPEHQYCDGAAPVDRLSVVQLTVGKL